MTEQDYNIALAFLKKADPDHKLLPSLQKGFSRINAKYLEHAMKRVSIVKVKTKDAPEDEQLNEYHLQKRQLYGERAKMSNKFHLCQTDKQRAEVSVAIQQIQRDIEAVNVDLRYYEENGKVKEVIEEEKYPVPVDPMDLLKKQNSIRASISRYKRQLDTLAALPEKHPKRNGISKIEKKLADKKIHLEHVKKAIEEKTIHD